MNPRILKAELYNPSSKLEFRSEAEDSSLLRTLFDYSSEIAAKSFGRVSRSSEHLPLLYRGLFQFGGSSWFRTLEKLHPIAPEAPFEKTDAIAGDSWLGGDLFGNNQEDAIVKLIFAPEANLPIHTHFWSDRVIYVVEGAGYYHFSWQPFRVFQGKSILTFEVSEGDLLVFSRGLLHTFEPSEEGLTLYSYHSPFYSFDHPRQYTLPEYLWYPKPLISEGVANLFG